MNHVTSDLTPAELAQSGRAIISLRHIEKAFRRWAQFEAGRVLAAIQKLVTS